MAALSLLVGTALVATTGGIYPEDHFERVWKPTKDNLEDLVELSVDSGKTLFVRWIASAG